MFHSQKVNHQIVYIHEKYLGIVYNDNISSFEELLKKNNKINVHDRDIQSLAIGHLNPLMHNVPEWLDTL